MVGSERRVSVNKIQCVCISKLESSHSKSRQNLWNNHWNGSFLIKLQGLKLI